MPSVPPAQPTSPLRPTSPSQRTTTPVPPTLDATAYPHILDSILSQAGYASLLALRTASRALKEICDTRLFEHVLVFADGRVASRLAPRASLPLLPPSPTALENSYLNDLSSHLDTDDPTRVPTVRLTDAEIKVMVVDIQCPHFDWAELRDVSHLDDNCPCGAPMRTPTGWDASRETSREASTGSCVPVPRHLAPLHGLDLSHTTVRRTGPHECWVPRGANALEHLGSAYTRAGGEWYIFSPSSPSRANMIRRGEREVFVLAGEGVRHILEAIRHPKARQRLEDQWSTDSEDGEEEEEEEEEEDTGLVDRCAGVIADFWVAMPPDALQTWVLVDAESWPSWSDGKHFPLSVEAGLRGAIRSRLVAAGMNSGQIQAVEQRLRFANWGEYVADIGPELVSLESDDHGFIFPP
ncbi:hypothetical protein CspeluHIS016_0103880 [Cutaneotrichosporon spelunceum]|uniref:F-box domain-containing protein n=1 Tax=Cutaneotrichosporon spelunceum TaxID=1672016 RepID=A0AAD3TNU5_9TREE|nr:hypothetical protein CspeluHIS016_0103880 [Cutaneotrichosporon spelunceum]